MSDRARSRAEVFWPAFGPGAIGLSHLEEGSVVCILRRVADEDQRVGAGGGVGFEVEAEGLAGCALREAGDEGALLGWDVGAAVGQGAFRSLRGGVRRGGRRRSGSGWWGGVHRGFRRGGSGAPWRADFGGALSRELAASFMKLAAVRMKILRGASAGEALGALYEGADLA